MLAHDHGQTFNASEIGRILGLADTTVKRYLDILTGTFMIRRLAPWFANLGRMQVKTPKIYFRDSGTRPRRRPPAQVPEEKPAPRLEAILCWHAKLFFHVRRWAIGRPS